MGRGVLAHEFQIVVSSSAVAVACGGLDPVGVDGATDFTELDLLGVVEHAVFEDDFDFGFATMGGINDFFDIFGDVVPIACLHFTNVDNHIEFGGTVSHGCLGFEDFDLGEV